MQNTNKIKSIKNIANNINDLLKWNVMIQPALLNDSST